MRYCLLLLFVVVAIVFVDCHQQQQQCIKLTTSLCDDDVNDDGIPGEAGPKGEKGDQGDQGESYDQNDVINDVITKMNETLYELKDTLVEVQGRLTKLELAEEDRNAVYELRLTPRTGNFNESREMCRQMGGDLMQKTLLTNTYGGNYLEKFRSISAGVEEYYVFIGITDLEVEGNWKFLNGEDYIPASSISNWRSNGEPNGERRENCGAAIATGSGPLILNDLPCTGYLVHGVCEIRI